MEQILLELWQEVLLLIVELFDCRYLLVVHPEHLTNVVGLSIRFLVVHSLLVLDVAGQVEQSGMPNDRFVFRSWKKSKCENLIVLNVPFVLLTVFYLFLF